MDLPYKAKMYQEIVNQMLIIPIHEVLHLSYFSSAGNLESQQKIVLILSSLISNSGFMPTKSFINQRT